jgi:hypothetical protein
MLFYDRVDPNSILVSDANTPVAAERISEDTKMPDMPLVDPAPWRAVPNPSAVREDEEILADSNPPMPFDNSLPLPGIPTPVGGLDEADGQQQPSSSDSDEPPEWLARPVARKPDPAEDQNMDQMPTEFSSPLTQVPEV